MRRGEIRLADLDPSPGSAANKRRPVVIVSNDGANATADRLRRGVVTVVPLTSCVAQIYPFQVMLPAGETGLDLDSKAQAEQVRSIDVERLEAPIGRLTPGLGLRLDQALRLHLGL
jgi:mRNA interferase MazF